MKSLCPNVFVLARRNLGSELGRSIKVVVHKRRKERRTRGGFKALCIRRAGMGKRREQEHRGIVNTERDEGQGWSSRGKE